MDRFPRFPLLWGETPLQPLPQLAKVLGVKSFWIKRDDLTGIAFGGNKLRKLEFLIGHAMEQNCNLILTAGSPQSNHARLTAAAATKAGIKTWLCFAGNNLGKVQGNLLLDYILDAEVFLTGRYGSDGMLIAMQEKAEEAKRLGYQPYIIPVGGSTTLGDYGYVKAWVEMEQQRDRIGIPPFDEIYVAAGSGGTIAGLLVGQMLKNDSHPSACIGISVWQKKESLIPIVRDLVNQLLVELHHNSASGFDQEVRILDHSIGPKYGVPSEEGNEAIRLLARTEGLFADPVYTGKALAGCIEEVQGRKEAHILFWHTGGCPAIFTHAHAFDRGDRK